MKRFLVKVIYTATKDNAYYEQGSTQTWYHSRVWTNEKIHDYLKDTAYKRKCDAQRFINRDKEFQERLGSKFWKVDYEIIDVSA